MARVLAEGDPKPKTAPQSSGTRSGVRWLTLVLIVGSEGLLLAALAFLLFWSDISNWLTSQGQALVALGAIATATAAIVGAFGLVAAAVAARAALRQVEVQREIAQREWKIAKDQSSRECLWRFTDEWRNEIVKQRESDNSSHWSRANKALESEGWKHDVVPKDFVGEADTDIREVLNFFDGIAYMRMRGDLDGDLAWSAFGSVAIDFYTDSRDFVSAYRLGLIKRSRSDTWPIERDMSYWQDFDSWYPEIVEIDDAKILAANKLEDAKARAANALQT